MFFKKKRKAREILIALFSHLLMRYFFKILVVSVSSGFTQHLSSVS